VIYRWEIPTNMELHAMSASFSRIVAAGLFAVGGTLVATFGFAIAVARALVTSGIHVRPADALVLDDLIPLMPFIAGFAVASLIAAVAVITERGRILATFVAGTAVVIGLLAVTLLILGDDPFAKVASDRALDGVEMIGAFTAIYAVALVAMAIARRPSVIRPMPDMTFAG
jgi:hypothetical protein